MRRKAPVVQEVSIMREENTLLTPGVREDVLVGPARELRVRSEHSVPADLLKKSSDPFTKALVD